VSIPFDQLTTLEASDAVSEHQAHDSAHTRSTPIIVISLLASMSLGTAALAHPVPSAGAEPFTQNCQTSDPRLERLASAIERGDLDSVRSALDEGLDVNETWRDVPAQICRSLLLRTVWHGRDDIFNLLLKRGADPRTIPDDALGIPVRTGRLDMVRTRDRTGLKTRALQPRRMKALSPLGPDLVRLEHRHESHQQPEEQDQRGRGQRADQGEAVVGPRRLRQQESPDPDEAGKRDHLKETLHRSRDSG
jgi:hypothetical protein